MRAGRPRSQSGQTVCFQTLLHPHRSERPPAYRPLDLDAGGTPALPVGPDGVLPDTPSPASVRTPASVSSTGPGCGRDARAPSRARRVLPDTPSPASVRTPASVSSIGPGCGRDARAPSRARRVLPDTPSPRLGQTARRRIIHWTLMRAGRPRSQSGQTCASRHSFTPPRSDRPPAYHPSDLDAGGTPALPVGPDVCFQTPLHPPRSDRPPAYHPSDLDAGGTPALPVGPEMRAGRPRSQSGQTCASRHSFTPPRSERPPAYRPLDLDAGGTPALPVGGRPARIPGAPVSRCAAGRRRCRRTPAC